MATEALVISINEKGALQVQRNIESIGAASKGASSSLGLMKGALSALAIVGITASLAGATQTMAQFSQEMSTVAGVIGTIDASKFQELESEARRLGATTRFSAIQSAQGMVELARAGFSADQTLASVGPTLMLAQAGALDLGRAAEITSNVLAGFVLQASQAQRVVDVLAQAANSSTSDVSDLGEAMSYVAPVSATLNVGLEETAAAVELLSNAGIKGSRAGTNLTAVMRLLQAPTEEQKKVLNELVLSQDAVNVGAVGLTAALENFRKAGASNAQIFEYFGRSASSASVLLRGAGGQLQQFTDANNQAAGSAERVAKVMDDNLNGALLAVRNSWESVILSFGDSGPEDSATKSLRDLAEALRYASRHIGSMEKDLVALGLAVAAVKFAPLINETQAAVAGFVALEKAVFAGEAVLLGSAQAQTMRAAATAAAAQVEAAATAETTAAALAKTAATAAAVRAQLQNAVAVQGSTTTEFARLAILKQLTLLDAQHAVELEAATAAQIANAEAASVANAAQAKSVAASTAATTGMMAFNLSARVTMASVRALGAALAANPITVGIAALAAGAIAINAIFDRIKDKQLALEAAEDKAYKTKLSAVQAQVKEIRTRKEAEVSLQNYLDGLDYENMLLAKGTDEREQFVSIAKAEEIARRELGKTEKQNLVDKLLLNKALKQEQGMLQSILDPMKQYQEELATLDRLAAKHLVDNAQYAQKKAALQDQYGQTDKFAEYIAKLDAETAALKLNADERKVRQDVISAASDVGRPLVGNEPSQVEARVRERNAMEELQATYQKIAGPMMEYAKLEQQLTALVKDHSISEQQKTFYLREAQEAAGGYDMALKKLTDEGKLLKMTVEERAKYNFSLQLTKDSHTDLSQTAIDAAYAQEKMNQAQYDYNELVRANKSPLMEMNNERSMLNRALDNGDISAQRYAQRMQELKRAEQELSPETMHLSDVMDTAWGSAKSVLDNFVDTGIFRIKDLEFAVIQSVTKMAAEFAMLQALKAAGNFITGGLDIGGLATGGSFMVGGSGGTDSQLVAFMASPNEQVDVSTPQQRAARAQGQQSAGGLSLTIVNLINPDDVPKAMAGRAGQDAILNVVSLNASTVRQMIS